MLFIFWDRINMLLYCTAMYVEALAVIDPNIFGAVGWVVLLIKAAVDLHPSSQVETDFAQAISSGCGWVDNHLCVRGGCYRNAIIARVGTPRPSITRTTPTFVEILHSTGYFRSDIANLTRFQSVECAVQYLPTQSHPMEFLVSLIPALCLAGIIIILLIFLRSANEPYILTKTTDIIEMNEINKDFVIENKSDEDDDTEAETADNDNDDDDPVLT